MTYYYLGSALLVLIIVLLALPQTRYVSLYRGAMVAMFLAFLGLSFFSFKNLTGQPRTVTVIEAMIYPEDAEVLAFYLVEDVGVYVLAQFIPNAPALYMMIEWDDKLVENLTKAAKEASEENTPLMVNFGSLFKPRPQGGDGKDGQRRPPGDGEGGSPNSQQGDDPNASQSNVFHAAPQPMQPDKPRGSMIPAPDSGVSVERIPGTIDPVPRPRYPHP